MTRTIRVSIVTAMIVTVLIKGLSAQLVVYDPANYFEAVSHLEQLIAQYRFWIAQAKRLPGDLGARYRVEPVRWRHHDDQVKYPYARQILTALNGGDVSGALYDQDTDRLEALDGLLRTVPSELQRRLQTIYGSIELGDSVAKMAINQIGTIRGNGKLALSAIQNMEDDAVGGSDSLNTQTALLNKINGATVLALRINENASQLQMHILEQLLVQNKRNRDAEAQIMNAHLFQWQYGLDYGRDLFAHTAASLDSWRQP